MKDQILGKNYNLTLVCVGDQRSRTLNRTYRGKDYPTNVLSFPLSKTAGEIYLALPRVRVDAKKFDMTLTNSEIRNWHITSVIKTKTTFPNRLKSF